MQRCVNSHMTPLRNNSGWLPFLRTSENYLHQLKLIIQLSTLPRGKHRLWIITEKRFATTLGNKYLTLIEIKRKRKISSIKYIMTILIWISKLIMMHFKSFKTYFPQSIFAWMCYPTSILFLLRLTALVHLSPTGNGINLVKKEKASKVQISKVLLMQTSVRPFTNNAWIICSSIHILQLYMKRACAEAALIALSIFFTLSVILFFLSNLYTPWSAIHFTKHPNRYMIASNFVFVLYLVRYKQVNMSYSVQSNQIFYIQNRLYIHMHISLISFYFSTNEYTYMKQIVL
jgi:hypothetical protein